MYRRFKTNRIGNKKIKKKFKAKLCAEKRIAPGCRGDGEVNTIKGRGDKWTLV